MRHDLILCFILSLFSPSMLFAQKCEVTVVGMENSTGEVRMYLFDNGEGFPEERNKALMVTTAKIVDQKALFSFQLVPGAYAVTFLHDEDMDGEMKYSWIGMPVEGFGFSNNPKIKLRAPTFDECSFTVNSNGCSQTLETIYY